MARLPLSYTWRNLFARRLRNGLTVAVIGLVVVAVSLIMVVIASLQRTLSATGSDRNLVVLRDGATSDGSSAISLEDARSLRFLEGIAVGPDAAPLAAPELVVQLPAGPPGVAPRGLTIRGVGGPVLDVHGGVRIARGRMLRPSSGEAVVGRAVVDVFGGLPAELRFGRGLWKVVGVLESGGSAYESEIWVDAHDLAADGRRLLPYSSIRLRVAPGVDPEELSRRIETDARFGLTARIESDYYAEQADSASAFYAVIFALAGLGGLGAAMGATNALSASVMARRREIGTLRALGFPAGAVLRAFLSEALMLGLAGFAAGAVAVWAFAWAISDSLGGISFGSSAAIFVDLAVTPRDLFPGLALALLIGLCGGLLPAARAARLRPIDALERR